MAVGINVKSLEEVPEVMREFVAQGSDGAFVYDEDKAFKALVEERNGRRADRKELAPFKALNKPPEELAKLSSLGKTSEEISEMITRIAKLPPELDPEKATEAEKARLVLEKEFRQYKTDTEKRLAAFDEMQRKTADAELRGLCEGLLDQLPPELDRDRTRLWLLGGKTSDGIDVQGTYRNFKRNAIGDIEEMNGLAPLDYLKAMGNALGYKKTSTPGKAEPGNASLTHGKMGAEYQAAREKGDIQGMLANVTETE